MQLHIDFQMLERNQVSLVLRGFSCAKCIFACLDLERASSQLVLHLQLF